MKYLLLFIFLIQFYVVFMNTIPLSTTDQNGKIYCYNFLLTLVSIGLANMLTSFYKRFSLVCCPDTITLSSKGWAVRRWGSRLGVFSLLHCDEGGNGVYEHALKNRFFLYRLPTDANSNWKKDVWMVGEK